MSHMHSPFIDQASLGSKARFRQLADTSRIYTLPAKPSLWRRLLAWC